MSSTLSPSGVKKPSRGDTGATFFDDLADFAQKFNDHRHTGGDSEQLTASSFLSEVVAVGSGSWGTSGEFQTVTVNLPSPIQYDTCSIEVRLQSTGEIIHPKIEKASISSALITSSEALAINVIVGI